MKRILAFAAAAMLLTVNAFAQNDENNPLLGHSFTTASGIVWAQCNAGATSPQEFGDYYKWTELSALSFPAPWRIPTFDEWGELVRNYKWEKIQDGDVTMWHVFDKNGNDLYLPVAGAMEGGKHRKFPFEYWTNAKYNGTPSRDDAAWVYDGQMMMAESMSTGLPVRMVKGDIIHATDVKVPASVDVTVGKYTRVAYTVLPEEADIKLVRFWSSVPAVNVSEDGVITGVKRGQYTIHADLFTATGYKTKDIRVTVKPGVTEFTCNASSITAFNATISGKFAIDSRGVLSKDIYILYSSEVSGADKLIAEGTSAKLDMDNDGNYKSRLHGLQPSTRYNFIIYAYVQGGARYYGGQESFTTKDLTAAAIDLGLPSGTKWAGINMDIPVGWGMLGKYGPEEYNNYYYLSQDESQLLTPYDIAAWKLGNNWRVPSMDEVRELLAGCDCYPYSDNALELVSKVNGNSIVLPIGSYWTSSRPAVDEYDSIIPGELKAFGADITAGGVHTDLFKRKELRAIRPVWRPVLDNYPTDIFVAEKDAVILLKLGESAKINFTLTPSDAPLKYAKWTGRQDSPVSVEPDGTITAIRVGTTSVTCSLQSPGAEKRVKVEVEVYNPDDYVDMGLSVLWAKNNLDKRYCWGAEGAMLKKHYKYWTGEVIVAYAEDKVVEEGLWAYCNDPSKGFKGDNKYVNGFTDNNTRLVMGADPASWSHMKNGCFRSPSNAEWEELANPANCDWENYTKNGVRGVKVTSRITGNSIFLPTTGYYFEGKTYGEEGSEKALGRYWTADLYEPDCLKAWTMEFNLRNNGGIVGNVVPSLVPVYRWTNQAIRPVLDLSEIK